MAADEPPPSRPPSSDAPVFTREGVSAGMPARRASTLLFAIENRSALLAARARKAMARWETERTAAEREQLFLGALAEGRSPPGRATIQDIDRHASAWRDLVPPDPALRAAVLARIADKYGLPPQARAVRAALGAEDADVAEAYARQTGRPLAEVGRGPLPRRERLRWFRDRMSRRIESLPAFWLAYVLTLTETVGGGVLALPIAFAGFGPVGATVMLVIFGLLNTLTVAALVEAITRNGNMRYGTAFFGRLIGDYLGRPGIAVAMPALFALDAVAFFILLVGFGTTIAAVTGLPVIACATVLFVVNGVLLWRDSLNVTVALAVAIGLINVALLVALSLIALATRGPEASSAPVELAFDASLLELIFGVALVAYFGHTSAGHTAKVVLARDPGGRQFLAGNIAAMLTAMGLYIVFVLAITSAVGADALAGYDGTALTPLAERVGPLADVLGTIYLVLAVGLGSTFVAFGIYNQMGELLFGTPRLRNGIEKLGQLGGFAFRAAPLVVIFAVAGVLLSSGSISFTEPINVIGTLTLPLLGGVFPMLVLVAARRRGDRIPGRFIGPLGWPVVAILIGAVFLAGVVSFGLWIWDNPFERAAAIGVGLAIVGLALVSARRGAFTPRTVVEYRVEAGPPAIGLVSVVSGGKAVPAAVRATDLAGERELGGPVGVVPSPGRLRTIKVDLPASVAHELTLWLHAVTPDGSSTAPAGPIDITIGAAPPIRFVGPVDRLPLPDSDDPTTLTLSMAPGSGST
jgi:amino acid permease